jgi:glycosyltransferase involved in cell wall biosynthesis
MKVLHVFHELKFSGAEIMYVDAANIFQEKGCELSVMATAIELGVYSINFQKAGYSVLHYPMPQLSKFFKRYNYYKKIITLLKSQEYDIIHIHSSRAMWGFSLCSWLSKVKSIYTFHNVFPTNFYSYPYHIFLRLTAKHIFKCRFQTIGDSVFKHEKKKYFNTTTMIPNWYSNKRYYSGTIEEKHKLRNELKIKLDTLVLISIGGCSEIKRHSDILKALPIILAKIPNTLYLHLGKGDKECEEYELAKSLAISENVIFCNNQEDVRKYLIASDIYLMPSKFEGISITTIEAMACGIPSILYDVPGLKDFNNEIFCSLLIPEDIHLLAKNILELIINEELKLKIKNNGISNVNKKFNMNYNANEIYNLYIK